MQAQDGLQKVVDKYFPHLQPGRDYRPIIAEELKRTSVYKIAIELWSGKKKEVGDFPGAFLYGVEQDKNLTADIAQKIAKNF